MAKKPILVVMAAGMGSRYGGLKQIDPVGPSGEAIIDYSLYDARRAGFETVVFIIKHEIEEAFKEAVGVRAERAGFTVRYAYQQLEKLPEGFTVPEGRVKPWGTAHAILVAEEAIGDAPFAVINADDYYGPQGFQLIYDYLSTHEDGDRYAWSMVGFLLGNTVSANGSVSRGVCVIDEQGDLVSVTERTCIEPYAGGIHFTEDGGNSWTDLPADTVVSMNLWGFTPGYIAEAKAGFAAFLQENLPVNPLKCEYYLPSVVTASLQRGEAGVHVLTSADKWYGITYREDKPELVEALRKMSADGLYPADKLF
ncbi:sugar phosphate nucleotidyltransferase [uncultured Subdoligranulum sp.]|uniref:nucleotidyltransferase family protein n=1 Tax=uncultured Subdoligranulum sp. TaxID=512298 RepID=UPI00261E4B43|nr:sugar phosphate nucleotidyltransferase [uncultured Subdoligranulum sp.]